MWVTCVLALSTQEFHSRLSLPWRKLKKTLGCHISLSPSSDPLFSLMELRWNWDSGKSHIMWVLESVQELSSTWWTWLGCQCAAVPGWGWPSWSGRMALQKGHSSCSAPLAHRTIWASPALSKLELVRPARLQMEPQWLLLQSPLPPAETWSCVQFSAHRLICWGCVWGRGNCVIYRLKLTLEAGEGRDSSNLWPVPLFVAFSEGKSQLSSHQLFFVITIAS